MAWSLRVDGLAAEISQELQSRGIPNIVLKGASLHAWLYGSGGPGRSYGDADLLVPPSQWMRAQSVLQQLGFLDASGNTGHPNMESITSHPWQRAEDEVDLHATLAGLGAEPETVWSVLSTHTEHQSIGGAMLPILDETARALHVCLHAAHHGPGAAKVIEDLDRALEVMPRERWREVADLAVALDAASTFAGGLRLNPKGEAILAELGLADVHDVMTELNATSVPLATGFNHLRELPDGTARVRYLLGELFPSAAFMRWWSPLARRGRRGLVAAYAWRWFFLVSRAPAGYLTYRRVARGARDAQHPDSG